MDHLQRGGSPTAFDRVFATRYSVAAAELVARGEFNRMVALQGNEIVSVPISERGGKTRTVPLDSRLIKTAKAVRNGIEV